MDSRHSREIPRYEVVERVAAMVVGALTWACMTAAVAAVLWALS